MRFLDAHGKRPPGPTSFSLISNLPAISKDPVSFFTRWSQQYGDFVYLKFLKTSICLFTHPREVEYVLVTKASKFVKTPDIRAIRMVLGGGLLTNEGASWQKRRKLAQPAFCHENLTTYGDLVVCQAMDMVDNWCNGQTIDIHQQMIALTLDVIAKSLLGSDLYKQAETIGDALTILMGQFVHLGTLAFLLPEQFPLPQTRKFRSALQQLDGIISNAINARRSKRGASNDLLEMFLQSQDEQKSELTDEDVRDEVKTFLVTGHETTANALTWIWYLLAQHPEVEATLHQELTRELKGQIPMVTDLPRLLYAEMVVKETLRFYPALAMIGRQAVEDFEVGGFHFPAGINVGMVTWNTHRDSRFFPEPDRFYPERWSSDARRSNPIPRFAYFPFGAGPRTCIGAGFAMMEITLILATIAQKYRLRLTPDQDVKILPTLTLRPQKGIRMTVENRDSLMNVARPTNPDGNLDLEQKPRSHFKCPR